MNHNKSSWSQKENKKTREDYPVVTGWQQEDQSKASQS